MSFTAEAKDELSRIDEEDASCALAELSAIMRVCGSLSFSGASRYSVRMVTETGSVARTAMRLLHRQLDLETSLTVRRSVQRKARNYLIEIPDQPQLTRNLVRLGIVVPDAGFTRGIPESLLAHEGTTQAFVRGAFLAGGFVADPRRDFHLEISVSSEELADALCGLLSDMGVRARLNHRRSSHAIYLKSFEGVRDLLTIMGAVRSATAVERMRQLKSVKNDVNRRVNADIANTGRASRSGAEQLHLIGRVAAKHGLETLPHALREFCELRVRNPEMSLVELGRLCDPPASKSAMYHRVLRLQKLAE